MGTRAKKHQNCWSLWNLVQKTGKDFLFVKRGIKRRKYNLKGNRNKIKGWPPEYSRWHVEKYTILEVRQVTLKRQNQLNKVKQQIGNVQAL